MGIHMRFPTSPSKSKIKVENEEFKQPPPPPYKRPPPPPLRPSLSVSMKSSGSGSELSMKSLHSGSELSMNRNESSIKPSSQLSSAMLPPPPRRNSNMLEYLERISGQCIVKQEIKKEEKTENQVLALPSQVLKRQSDTSSNHSSFNHSSSYHSSSNHSKSNLSESKKIDAKMVEIPNPALPKATISKSQQSSVTSKPHSTGKPIPFPKVVTTEIEKPPSSTVRTDKVTAKQTSLSKTISADKASVMKSNLSNAPKSTATTLEDKSTKAKSLKPKADDKCKISKKKKEKLPKGKKSVKKVKATTQVQVTGSSSSAHESTPDDPKPTTSNEQKYFSSSIPTIDINQALINPQTSQTMMNLSQRLVDIDKQLFALASERSNILREIQRLSSSNSPPSPAPSDLDESIAKRNAPKTDDSIIDLTIADNKEDDKPNSSSSSSSSSNSRKLDSNDSNNQSYSHKRVRLESDSSQYDASDSERELLSLSKRNPPSKPLSTSEKAENVSIFVRNIHLNTSISQLKSFFSDCGRIRHAWITGRDHLGFTAMIDFEEAKSADHSVVFARQNMLNGQFATVYRNLDEIQKHVGPTSQVSAPGTGSFSETAGNEPSSSRPANQPSSSRPANQPSTANRPRKDDSQVGNNWRLASSNIKQTIQLKNINVMGKLVRKPRPFVLYPSEFHSSQFSTNTSLEDLVIVPTVGAETQIFDLNRSLELNQINLGGKEWPEVSNWISKTTMAISLHSHPSLLFLQGCHVDSSRRFKYDVLKPANRSHSKTITNIERISSDSRKLS